jgi:hypothetical protein
LQTAVTVKRLAADIGINRTFVVGSKPRFHNRGTGRNGSARVHFQEREDHRGRPGRRIAV